MTDATTGFKGADKVVAKKPEPKTETKLAKGVEVESNHNTLEPAKPVDTAQVRSMPDYNPMRREGGPANVKSDTTMNEDDNADLVDAKGDRPTVAEVAEDGKDDGFRGTVSTEANPNPDADKKV